MLAGHLLGLLCGDLSLKGEVGLATKYDRDHISDAILVNGIDPVRSDCLKRLSARQVEADDDAVGLLVECGGEAAISLLSGCVPKDDFIVLGALDSLQPRWPLVSLNVINTICRHPSWAEILPGEYLCQASLADSCIAH